MTSVEPAPKTIAVVVPFLNEEDNIPEMYRRLDALFAGMLVRYIQVRRAK
ncbi:MAG: hypothetical protein ACO3ZG_08080 [Kiritimatiellia bacterium]